MSRYIYSLTVKGNPDTNGDHVSFENRSAGIEVFVRRNGEVLQPFTIPHDEFEKMVSVMGIHVVTNWTGGTMS